MPLWLSYHTHEVLTTCIVKLPSPHCHKSVATPVSAEQVNSVAPWYGMEGCYPRSYPFCVFIFLLEATLVGQENTHVRGIMLGGGQVQSHRDVRSSFQAMRD